MVQENLFHYFSTKFIKRQSPSISEYYTGSPISSFKNYLLVANMVHSVRIYVHLMVFFQRSWDLQKRGATGLLEALLIKYIHFALSWQLMKWHPLQYGVHKVIGAQQPTKLTNVLVQCHGDPVDSGKMKSFTHCLEKQLTCFHYLEICWVSVECYRNAWHNMFPKWMDKKTDSQETALLANYQQTLTGCTLFYQQIPLFNIGN